mmetsp:Transcript_8053/g.25591  ORF Transcript_8053/g.25591 Transcript_8053/m.25591 type:complete len:215 (+) Transcript_8053:197-841(+)
MASARAASASCAPCPRAANRGRPSRVPARATSSCLHRGRSGPGRTQRSRARRVRCGRAARRRRHCSRTPRQSQSPSCQAAAAAGRKRGRSRRSQGRRPSPRRRPRPRRGGGPGAARGVPLRSPSPPHRTGVRTPVAAPPSEWEERRRRAPLPPPVRTRTRAPRATPPQQAPRACTSPPARQCRGRTRRRRRAAASRPQTQSLPSGNRAQGEREA